jgi:UDP-2-acetamido-2-deoxy-ribo-hexuluronate aminotransferase
VKTPNIASDKTIVYAQYTIEVSHRDKVQQQLQQRGIPTAVYYPLPLNLQYNFINQAQENFSVAETVAQRVLSLPIHPYLTTENQTRIINTLKNLL